MLMRRKLSVGIAVALVLTLLTAVTASAQEAAVGGSANFRDSGTDLSAGSSTLGDTLVLTLTGVPAPTAGTAYEGWVLDASGGKISVGVLTRASDGTISQTYTDSSGVNLLGTYQGFAISEEPVPDPDAATAGTILYSDLIPAGAFTHIGHLVVSRSSNPDGKGIATGLREQMDVALTHAVLAQNSTDLTTKQLHSHHVVNIIEGTGGANYDASFAGHGDGFGVLNYAADAVTHAGLAKAAAPDNTTVVAKADELIAAANRVTDFATRARDAALLVVNASSDNIVVAVGLQNAVNLTTDGLDGTDEDGDAVLGASGAEGGAKTAYLMAQDMGQFELQAGSTALTPITGDLLVPVIALAALIAGAMLVTGGGLLLFRRRRVA